MSIHRHFIVIEDLDCYGTNNFDSIEECQLIIFHFNAAINHSLQ